MTVSGGRMQTDREVNVDTELANRYPGRTKVQLSAGTARPPTAPMVPTALVPVPTQVRGQAWYGD